MLTPAAGWWPLSGIDGAFGKRRLKVMATSSNVVASVMVGAVPFSRMPYTLDASIIVPAVVMAYNFARHLKALRWRTPFKVICEVWT